MAAFLLNPYDSELDLTNKDDRKLYENACKGLKEDSLFNGKRENYSNFVKLIEKEFKNTRMMEALEISREWDDLATAVENRRLVTSTVDIFKTNKVAREEVLEHCSLVWAATSHGNDTPKYFKRFESVPTDTAELNKARNQRRLKHVMMGNKIWNSLSASFQIDIMGSKVEFERYDEYDGPLLWDFIRRRINPSTTVGASRLKDEIETKTLKEFGDDVTKFNTWFADTRDLIIKEEGTGYNEYVRSLFRAYRTCANEEFVDTILSERRDWIQGKTKATYSHVDLMELARLTYNNLVEDQAWAGKTATAMDDKPDASKEANYLALATQLIQRVNELEKGGGKPTKGGKQSEVRNFGPWRFENPTNAKTKVVEGTTMRWCTNDCHSKPMWCGRINCMSRADHAEHMRKRREGGSVQPRATKNGVTKDFKIALAAITSPDDFSELEKQFFSSKE